MKKHTLFHHVLVFVVSLILFSNCTKDFLSNGSGHSSGTDIEEAKAIFEANATDLREIDFNFSTLPPSTRSSTKSVVTPKWENPFIVSTEKFTIFEVPLVGDVKKYAFASYQKDGIQRRAEVKKVTTKLILKRNNKTGDYIYFIATMVGCNEDKNVKEINYTNNRSFTGHIFISNLAGHCAAIYKSSAGVRQRAHFLKVKTETAGKNKNIDGTMIRMVASPAAAYNFGETGYCDRDPKCTECLNKGATCSRCQYCNVHLPEVPVSPTKCNECGGPYNNCYCCFICGNYPCTCYTPDYNCSYCGSYFCNGECQNTCYYCGSRYCSGSCQSTGGGTTDPEPKECSHVICSECILPINTSGSATRSIPNCSHLKFCACWWGSGHNKLMEDALGKDLTEAQLNAVKKGSKEADQDPYQEVKYAHMHAMIQDGKTLEEAKLAMREHFIAEVTAYKTLNNYERLGFALHMIQDTYSPAHSLKNWDGSVISYVPHIFEGRIFNRPGFNDALEATKYIYQQISWCESSDESIGAVFDVWLSDYESQHVEK